MQMQGHPGAGRPDTPVFHRVLAGGSRGVRMGISAGDLQTNVTSPLIAPEEMCSQKHVRSTIWYILRPFDLGSKFFRIHVILGFTP